MSLAGPAPKPSCRGNCRSLREKRRDADLYDSPRTRRTRALDIARIARQYGISRRQPLSAGRSTENGITHDQSPPRASMHEILDDSERNQRPTGRGAHPGDR